MRNFINNDFLLSSYTAKRLYHDYAASLPIIDYHNHLSAKEIYEKRSFHNLAQVWLESDHYKWRLMRVCGVNEHYITGNASDWEKFQKWAEIFPKLIGNPVFYWTQLELQRYFGIYDMLGPETAKVIWERSKNILEQPNYNSCDLLKRMKVKVLCTTNGPCETLEWHQKIRKSDDFGFCVLPTFRPDTIFDIGNEVWNDSVRKIAKKYKTEIRDWESLTSALSGALDYFCANGCVLADHGFAHFLYVNDGKPEKILKKALSGETITPVEKSIYQGALLRFFGEEYSQRDMVMQLHLGAIRNTNTLQYERIGNDAGCDSVGEETDPVLLAAFLDDLEKSNSLPKTILYGLNPGDNTMLSTMAVNFAGGGIPGRVQYGSAWWFQDHLRGIRQHIDELMETGLISSFVGMLTDSRSFTSFCRHEFFRRILCDKIGSKVENGEYPNDIEMLGKLVTDICYENAVRYFRLLC